MLLFVLLCLAAVQDIRSGKVANRLIAMGLLAGAVFQAAEHQAWGRRHQIIFHDRQHTYDWGIVSMHGVQFFGCGSRRGGASCDGSKPVD